MDPRDKLIFIIFVYDGIILCEIIPPPLRPPPPKKRICRFCIFYYLIFLFSLIRCFGRTSFVQTDDKRRSNSLGFFVEIRVQLRGFESQKKNSQRHKRRFGGHYERSDGFHKCLFTTAWSSRGGKVNSLRVQKSRFLRRWHDIGSSSRVSKVPR